MKFFVLGTHRELSIAEITAVTGISSFASTQGDALLVDTDLPSQMLQDRLAGTIKVGSIVGELKEWDKEACAELIASMIDRELPRVEFGVSVYDAGDAHKAKELRLQSQKLGLEIKKNLKANGKPVRLVTSKEKTLSAVVVTTNKLLERGGEFVLIAQPDTILIGQTDAVQDFEAWSKRDFGRPARDAKSGMLPPKLARMMANLSGKEPTKSSLLDPFCGSGTVLMEAALMGFTRVVGSDISPKAVADTKTNIDWLALTQPSVEILLSPAQFLDEKISGPFDAIVTETYLGPALHGNEHAKFLKQNADALSVLYRDAFGTLGKLLAPDGTVVVAFPVFTAGAEPVATRKMMESVGFHVETVLRYERAGQHVARDIFVMTKEKSRE